MNANEEDDKSLQHIVSIRQVTLNAIDQGEFVTLLDRKGRQIGCRRRLTELEGLLDPSAIPLWQWRWAVQRMRLRLSRRNERRCRTPWEKRTDSLAKSIGLRRRDRPYQPQGRQRFQSYPTHSWPEACRRLWTQGNNRFRRHSRDGWTRWTHTVSNNHNKRKGGRYAHEAYRDRQDDHGTD